MSALAQTVDGYLWAGTSDGLFRFDGLTFDRYELSSAAAAGGVSALMADADGGLWIGYEYGGASLLKRGRLTEHAPTGGDSALEGFPKGRVNGFARTRNGTLWVGAVGGAARMVNDHWLRIRADPNKILAQIWSVLADREGNLWLGTHNRLLLVPKGKIVPLEQGVRGAVHSIAQAPGGEIWYSNHLAGVVRAVGSPPNKGLGPLPQTRRAIRQIHFDHDGALWIAGDGLLRIPFPVPAAGRRVFGRSTAIESLTYPAELTDVTVNCLLEDREGNVWLGTGNGLERFRHRNLSWFNLKPGTHNYAMVARENGEIWAWPRSSRGRRIPDGKVLGTGPTDVWIARPARDGGVWLAGITAFWHWDGKNFLRLHSPVPEPFQVTAITTGIDGTLWVSEMGDGVIGRKDGKWIRKNVPGLPEGKAEAACTDYAGRVWWAYSTTLAMVDQDHAVIYSAESGLDIGRIRSIASRPQQVWAGGKSGLAFLLAGRFHRLKIAGGVNLGSVHDLVATTSDGLWLNALPGIVHVPERAVQSAVKNPADPVQVDVFDLTSDLPEALQSGEMTNPSIVREANGILWFATRQGVARVDPARILKNPHPPPVSIRAVVADGKSYSTFVPASLPPLTKDLQIDYTALSLSIPEKSRFRYRLVGRDQAWQEVGARRQAFYTNLKPGSYTFQVIACNSDGVWNETGASWSFRLEPAFYQTSWFEVLGTLIALGLAWSVYAFRINRATAQIQARLGERMVERERIARELHDTLLQGFQGLVLRFEAAKKQLPADAPARTLMERALDRADQVLTEGRSRVRDLRSEDPSRHDLSESLAACVAELSHESDSSCSLLTSGTPRPIDPVIHDEIHHIGREALTNAVRHAKASKIEVEISHAPSRFLLRVRDNGCGIDQSVLERGKAGHWGLIGVRERAQKIGGTLRIWSKPGAGTEIELEVSAQLVYRSTPGPTRWRRLKRLIQRGRSIS